MSIRTCVWSAVKLQHLVSWSSSETSLPLCAVLPPPPLWATQTGHPALHSHCRLQRSAGWRSSSPDPGFRPWSRVSTRWNSKWKKELCCEMEEKKPKKNTLLFIKKSNLEYLINNIQILRHCKDEEDVIFSQFLSQQSQRRIILQRQETRDKRKGNVLDCRMVTFSVPSWILEEMSHMLSCGGFFRQHIPVVYFPHMQ